MDRGNLAGHGGGHRAVIIYQVDAYIIHINTELRMAWKHGLEVGLARREDEVVPYKILPPAVAAIHNVVSAGLRLFGGRN